MVLGTDLPLEGVNFLSVSPLSSHHGSRSSTPGVLPPDGTRQQLLTPSPLPRPRSCPASLDVAMKPACLLAFALESHTSAELPQVDGLKQGADLEPVCSPPMPPAPPSEPPTPDVPSLSHIAHTLRLQKYQKRHRQQLQLQLRDLRVATARTVRLTSIARSIQHTLAECIRCEDKASFTSLFNAFQVAQDDCHRVATEPAGSTGSDLGQVLDSPESFLDMLPEQPRAATLDLLTAIRYDGDFIADRLASLSHKELLSLLQDRGNVRSAESVFGSSYSSYSRTSRHMGYAVDGQADLISSQAFGSALETLVHCVQGVSEGSISEDSRSLEVWSTVCARAIGGQSSGSEKLVPSVLDIWASSAKWPGKERLGLWILQTLQGGSFLIEQPSKQSFRIRVQGRPEASAEEEIRTEFFYTQATNEFLDLLADQKGASVIPEAVLRICRAIWTKLQAGHQRAFPHFVLTRWLFSSFFFEVISLPEAFGLVPECYISDSARHRILREVANRAQKAIFDVAYSWKHGNIVPVQTTRRVQAIMSRFQGQCDPAGPSTLRPIGELRGAAHAGRDCFVVVSALDIVRISKALYPRRRPASFSSEADAVHSGLQSSASSISGFSMFKHSGSLDMSPKHLYVGPQEAFSLPTLEPQGSLRTRPESMQTDALHGRLMHDEVDPEQLWEACTGIEDMLGPAASPTDQWASLMTTPGERKLSSSCDQLPGLRAGTNGQCLEQDNRADDPISVPILEQLLREWPQPNDPTGRGTSYEVHAQLTYILERRVDAAEEVSDFIEAHRWSKQLQRFRLLQCHDPYFENLRAALESIERGAQHSLDIDELTIGAYEGWFRLLKPALDRLQGELAALAETVERLRDTMWFVADVRTSAAYDEARSVAGALRIMGKPKRPSRTRMAPPLRHWSGSKLSNTGLHLKTEAQILELLSALPDQGGPNKLSDDQARSTLQWMERNSIENLCRGEERLHRLCMEVRKCVERLVSSESLLLSSNPLFSHCSQRTPNTSHAASFGSLSALQGTAARLDQLTLQTNVAPSINSVSSASNALSSASSRDFLESRSPTLTHKSSAPFWSPAMTEEQSPSSATSIGSYHTHTPSASRSGVQRPVAKSIGSSRWLEQLKRSLTSLLLSDLTSTLFNDGSETDRAFWTGIGGDLVGKHLRNLYAPTGATKHAANVGSGVPWTEFDYDQAYRRMLASFSASSDPTMKLSILYDIDRLLYLRADEERGTMRPSTHSAGVLGNPSELLMRNHVRIPKSEENVAAFCRLFSNTGLRPPAIFRDLQYIAALVPATVLESTPQGKAFWNAAIATSQLKHDARNIMVETADSIIAYHSNNRGHGRSSSSAQQQRDSATFSTPSRTSSAEDFARYSMADAAYLLQITAKEGDPVAQRELATLYLTHPELMDHIIAPFARPRDVFKEELESKWRKNQDPNRCDPATMCVAHHWMSLSSKGGDALAKEYLRQREEMERLP